MAEKSKTKGSPKKKEKKQARAKAKKDNKKEEQQEQQHKKQEERAEEQLRKILPPLDFSSLVLPFFTQALLELNDKDDATATQREENLKLTQRLIDLLNLLKEKTKGNLKPEEEIFLDQCLHQLRMAYMEKARVIKL